MEVRDRVVKPLLSEITRLLAHQNSDREAAIAYAQARQKARQKAINDARMAREEKERVIRETREDELNSQKSIRALCRAEGLGEEMAERWISEGRDIFEVRGLVSKIQEQKNTQEPLGRYGPIFKDEMNPPRSEGWEPLIRNRNY